MALKTLSPSPRRTTLILTLLLALLALPCMAITYTYHGRAQESAIPGRYLAEVRDQNNKIVWSSNGTFGSRDRAQRRADRKAKKLNKGEGVLPSCEEDPNMRHCNPGY